MDRAFDLASWKAQIAAWWREAAQDLDEAAKRTGVRTAYGLLAASAWLPLLAAYGAEPGPAITALVGIVGSVGSNLVANLVQGAYDRSKVGARAEHEVAERAELRPEYQQMLNQLDVLAAAQAALGERWETFEAQLQEELRSLGGGLQIDTGGAAIILGDVVVARGDFVARDKNVFVQAGPTGPNLRALLQAYLGALAVECSRLPLGVVDPRFLPTGAERRVALPDVYVDLDVVAPSREKDGRGDEPLLSGRLMRAEGGDRMPLLEAIAQPDKGRFVLLGDPGSGKTTFANYVAYALASGVLDQPWRGLLPVRLVLRDVAAGCIPADAAQGHASMLWDALRADLARHLGEEPAEALFRHLQARLLKDGGLVLLDGLDEVPEADSRRRCLLEAIEGLCRVLPKTACRILVTARPYAYQDPKWHLEGFETLVLAPFSDDQVARFVDRWYEAARPVMGWDAATAQARAARLREALNERPYLADLAVRPLLLTLMATLHASWGQLPEDEADLYEETVKLLISRWQRAVEVQGPDGKPVIEPGIAKVLAWGERPLRSALHRLAFEAHERQGAGAQRASDPADISEGDVLGAFAPLLPDSLDPRVLLHYLETRAGLLVARAPRTYAFPHRSFQEYLAACHLADRPDSARELRDRFWADPDWWRQVLLLGVGRAKQGGLGNAVHVVNTLVPVGPEEVAGPEGAHWQAAYLAGRALADLHFPAPARDALDFEAVFNRVRRWLASLMETPDALAIGDRARAGDVLARLGDPRPGVTVYYPEHAPSAVPDILWIEVPPGPFVMGSAENDQEVWDDERPQHTVELPRFLIARYPITNAQYRPFVEGGGYDEPRYWTADGWAWRTGEREADLSAVADEDFRRRYEQWLAQRPAERRDRPFWWEDAHWGLANRPVVGVSWYEALAFSAWLTSQIQAGRPGLRVWREGETQGLETQPDHLTARLPSEAEWETAARGTDGRRYPWGDAWAEGRANTEEAGIGQTSVVGLFPGGASPSGALDMAGNVWEWTRSRWGRSSILRPDYAYPYEAGDGREALDGPDLRIVRGGSWIGGRRFAGCACRNRDVPDFFVINFGFRVVVSLALRDSES